MSIIARPREGQAENTLPRQVAANLLVLEAGFPRLALAREAQAPFSEADQWQDGGSVRKEHPSELAD
jgi:hypothetical protein